eukprot:GHVU01000895.1.p1 GENE.GHVU01000895.1~~GHVU01000895.1.p1  ORF type:complete len:296 (+),score=25.67 GHVU01000895.1:758-1645(+)
MSVSQLSGGTFETRGSSKDLCHSTDPILVYDVIILHQSTKKMSRPQLGDAMARVLTTGASELARLANHYSELATKERDLSASIAVKEARVTALDTLIAEKEGVLARYREVITTYETGIVELRRLYSQLRNISGDVLSGSTGDNTQSGDPSSMISPTVVLSAQVPYSCDQYMQSVDTTQRVGEEGVADGDSDLLELHEVDNVVGSAGGTITQSYTGLESPEELQKVYEDIRDQNKDEQSEENTIRDRRRNSVAGNVQCTRSKLTVKENHEVHTLMHGGAADDTVVTGFSGFTRNIK